MQIEFDSVKDASNLAKHGVSLVMAADPDWDSALIWQDTRHAYGEVRMVALAPQAQTLYFVAYVDRGAARRIISLRRANTREFIRYESIS